MVAGHSSRLVGLVDDERVRHFDDARLEKLHLVAAERLQNQVDPVRQVADVDLALAYTDGLDQNSVEQAG